jgi:hypothetical protein
VCPWRSIEIMRLFCARKNWVKLIASLPYSPKSMVEFAPLRKVFGAQNLNLALD